MSGTFSEPSSLSLPIRPFRFVPAATVANLFPLKMSLTFNAALPLLSRQEPLPMTDLYPEDGAQVGDVGLQIIVQVLDQNGAVIDIGGAVALKIKLLKPDGTTLDKTASFLTDGSDGKIYYTTIVGDLNQAGLWQVQGKLTLDGTAKSTRLAGMIVAENVDNN